MSLADRRLCHTLTAEHGTDGRFGWQSALEFLRSQHREKDVYKRQSNGSPLFFPVNFVNRYSEFIRLFRLSEMYLTKNSKVVLGLSGGAPDSVRCARLVRCELAALGIRRRCTNKKHQTVRWCTGLSGESSATNSSLSGKGYAAYD